MKKLANEYFYSSDPKESNNIEAVRNHRHYKTKMKPTDLPEWYCDVHRYWWNRNLINTKGVVDIKYSWIRENHFMKDSVLRISYTGKIEEYYPEYTIGGKNVKSVLSDYKNVDTMVFSNGIFKCLAYIEKYSNYDLSEVRKEFVKQCNWLKKNEPEFAPDTKNFGKWFDEKIKEEFIDK